MHRIYAYHNMHSYGKHFQICKHFHKNHVPLLKRLSEDSQMKKKKKKM